ncbi:MAG TPA: DUF1326 domain-containing protein [Verrucomicrobiae bacterium]|nr:DUF1326 domain-containing protein [Verrucomicrobiae bacterium]
MKNCLKFGVLLSAVILAAGVVAEQTPKKTPWKITGQLEEACLCNAACPCWFNSMPSKMQCGGGFVLFIDHGHYGKVKLDGLAMGEMGQSPKGETMMNSYGNWEFSYLYIDERASEEQRAALKALGMIIMNVDASKNTEIRVVPITRQIDGKEHKIALGKYGTFHGHLVEGGLGGTVKIINPPGADPLHREYLQGETSKLTYTDAGQNWDAKDSNYMFGTFTVDSEQYAKYTAGLSQKMAEMQKQKSEAK